MNNEDKITFQDLADWLDKPLSNSDIDLINFILVSIENRYKHHELQQKVNHLELDVDSYKTKYERANELYLDSSKKLNQLETNRDEAIKLIKSKNNGVCIKNGIEKNAYTFLLDFDEAREFVWELEEILERGKE